MRESAVELGQAERLDIGVNDSHREQIGSMTGSGFQEVDGLDVQGSDWDAV